MFIKSIVLDGFKSYGNRVEITGFDPEFNAITGLNGTGKSNILDSICFVLGITNLSNVRASSLQELIYKHGQAGITKATVSITFDNSNKSQSPIGYESHREITVTRQVVMGGKNKYLINGINVQNKRVNDLFCSIQLNVNNPHFLIMQGRITKVLNMKPPEILSMVEEAAGTRMYESKKQAAQKTIEKKDAKLRELNDIIKEDIAPKLQKLQDERSQFQEYQKVVRELENLTRLYVAWRYVSAEESCKEAEGKVTEVKEQIEDKKNQIKGNEKETKQLEKQVAELNKKLDEESGSILKTLETELQTIEKTEASATSALRAAREALLTHEKRGRLLEKALRDDEAARSNKSSVLDKASATFSSLKAASEASEAALSAAQSRFLAVSSGLEGDDSLQDRLMAAKQEASEASTIIAQSSMEKKHVEESLKSLQKTFSSSASQYARDQESIGRQQAEVNRLQTELASLNFSEERHTSLKESCRGLQQAARAKRDAVDRQAARAQRCNFRYSDPEPGFDRRRIPGILCRQFEVKDSTYTMALETVARGSLYNVIVDTDVTGQLLLERGQLQSRVTCIPLNKIQAHVIDQRTLRTARDIGGGPENVQLALDLITYDQRLHKALAFVFGQTLVCRDVETAKLLAYDRRVAKRCVTWDGDVFNPGGNISGGARPKGEPVLVQLAELRRLENELQAADHQLQQSSAELTRLQATADTYHQKRQRFETMSYELEGTKARLLNTSHAQTHHEIESLQEKLAELNRRTEENRTRQKEAAARAKELEVKVKDIKGHREREYKKAEEDLKKAKQQAEKDNASWKNREQEFETLRLELQELETAVQTSREQLEQTSFAAVELKDQLDVASREHDAAANAVKQQQSRIKKQKAEIAHRSSDIGRLQQQQEALQQSSNQLQLDIKQLEYSITALQTEAADAEKRIKSLESEHPWIQSERQYFGAAGGLYDFQAKQAHVAGQRLSQLKERKDKLARGLNARAHTLLGKEEEQYQDVMRKKEIVEADRAKLVQVMTELDAKKQRTLITACEQVNKDFASIFSTLLPGACAKLQPPGGLSVLDGLEVKVGFNNTWKESLGELSGGQRSLVALSLVLAMLLFKPAPLYILDEVDAALDLSHTQNIGQMLKAHFTSSQFIIVSLKDGMFNNANVLFRTRFVDGMSAVQRTVNSRT